MFIITLYVEGIDSKNTILSLDATLEVIVCQHNLIVCRGQILVTELLRILIQSILNKEY